MSEKNQIVIQDACILFDLVDLSLLKIFFQLDLTVLTTPQVMAEITDVDQLFAIESHVNNGQLMVDSEGTYEAISEIFQKFPGLSFADSSVLELSHRKKAVILSSDGGLRKISTRQNIRVRGTLWIVKELYLKGIITCNYAIEKLEIYPTVNNRAPVKEINQLVSELKKLTK